MQCAELGIAILLLNLAFTIINRCIINKNKYFSLIFAVIFVTISFACYQSMVPLMITFSAFFAMLFIKEKNEKGIKIILEYILIFAISMVLYNII